MFAFAAGTQANRFWEIENPMLLLSGALKLWDTLQKLLGKKKALVTEALITEASVVCLFTTLILWKDVFRRVGRQLRTYQCFVARSSL